MSRSVAVAVFAPSPVVTVMLEPGDGEAADIHFHAGGQGFWVARMAAELGARVILCCALGGESGRVLAPLLEAPAGIEVRVAKAQGANGAYVHDRRGGSRVTVAEAPGGRLSRHELDDLYGLVLTAALECDVALLTGPQHGTPVDADVYRRLALDLERNGRPVLADLSGDHLSSALAGGLELVKLNDEQVVRAGFAHGTEREQLVGALERMRQLGARNALITRGPEPALALADQDVIELSGPRFDAVDPRGSGDAMFAALGVGLAAERPLKDALRMGVAAGALNATRHGLGSGHRSEIARLADHVQVRSVTHP